MRFPILEIKDFTLNAQRLWCETMKVNFGQAKRFLGPNLPVALYDLGKDESFGAQKKSE